MYNCTTYAHFHFALLLWNVLLQVPNITKQKYKTSLKFVWCLKMSWCASWNHKIHFLCSVILRWLFAILCWFVLSVRCISHHHQPTLPLPVRCCLFQKIINFFLLFISPSLCVVCTLYFHFNSFSLTLISFLSWQSFSFWTFIIIHSSRFTHAQSYFHKFITSHALCRLYGYMWAQTLWK